MVNKEENSELFNAKMEAEELAYQLADMIGVTLYYAGVKRGNLKDAVMEYLNAMDILFKDEEHVEYGFEEIVKIVEYLKENKKQLFE